jgi:hypothetical protein
MISIIDAEELRNVLRPTVYRPSTQRCAEPSAKLPSGDGAANREQMSGTAQGR